MRRLHANYRDRGLQIIGINVDDEFKPAVKLARKERLSFPHAFDGSGTVKSLYQVESIPQTYLLDRDMRIVAVGLHGEELERKIRSLFD